MGREYRLCYSNLNTEVTLTFLRQHFTIDEASGSLWQVTLTDSENDALTTWPHAFIAFEDCGIYFCDNLTSLNASAIILRQLIDFLFQTDVKVRIEEL